MAQLVKKRPYHGLNFTELTSIQPDVNASFTWSKKDKSYLRGKLTLDRHTNSIKYGNEVVLTVWSREPPELVPRANNDGYFRIEIPVPEAVFMRMMEDAAANLWALRIQE